MVDDRVSYLFCNIDIGQCEHLSCLSERFRNIFLKAHNTRFIEHVSSELEYIVIIYLKLVILLYPDDTDILANQKDLGLQAALNAYCNYCMSGDSLYKFRKTLSKAGKLIKILK